MKLLLILPFISTLITTQSSDVKDFLALRRHLIIYADGVPKELINSHMPVINSWRSRIFEVRNLCKIIDCNYVFTTTSQFPNRYRSNKCYLELDRECKAPHEKSAVVKLEEIFHESDYMGSIDLDGESFGMIANSRTEDSVVFEVGDSNMSGDGDGERPEDEDARRG